MRRWMEAGLLASVGLLACACGPGAGTVIPASEVPVTTGGAQPEGASEATNGLGATPAQAVDSTPPAQPTRTDSGAAQSAPPGGHTSESALHAGILARLSEDAPSPCEESALPARYRGSSPSTGANLGRGLALALPASSVLARREGDRIVVVYRSYRLDPSSELGDAGYRVRIVEQGQPERDFSLGTQELRPWVIVPNERLPIFDGEFLQFAADVRELDDDSISFPPVGLRALREATGRMLRCSLAALERDTDGDGLTDLAEARLATDPQRADTDGDGAADGVDSTPLGGTLPATEEQRVIALVLSEVVVRDVPDQLVLLEVEGKRIDVRAPGLRVLELTSDELAAYRARFGFRVSISLDVRFPSPTEATVALSFGWRGEEWTLRRSPDGSWRVEGGGMSWIT